MVRTESEVPLDEALGMLIDGDSACKACELPGYQSLLHVVAREDVDGHRAVEDGAVLGARAEDRDGIEAIRCGRRILVGKRMGGQRDCRADRENNPYMHRSEPRLSLST